MTNDIRRGVRTLVLLFKHYAEQVATEQNVLGRFDVVVLVQPRSVQSGETGFEEIDVGQTFFGDGCEIGVTWIVRVVLFVGDHFFAHMTKELKRLVVVVGGSTHCFRDKERRKKTRRGGRVTRDSN